MPALTIAVVGGGITGLAAAWELTRHLAHLPEPARVLVLEDSPLLGGKLRTAEVAGQQMDVGAESVLARRPEALDLLAEAGLSEWVVHPTAAAATIWSRGRQWSLPPRTLMGVPSEPDSALGLLTPEEVARLRAEPRLPPVTADISVGDFVEARVGAAVVDRLVEPLLAGVYAGHARRLSLRATVPTLWAAAQNGAGLVETADAAARRTAADVTGGGQTPVFAGCRGGLGQMVDHLAARLRAEGVQLRTAAMVREVERTTDGWTLVVGPPASAERLTVDAVVLATPAAPTARLLRSVSPHASEQLSTIDYASMAIISLALRRQRADPGPGPALSASGFLVPPGERVTIKAATFSTAKWEWVAALDPDVVHLRTSVGRAGETATLQQEDEDLVATAMADLSTVLGAGLPTPLDAHVQRWGGALPQYAVGHVDRVEAIQAAAAVLPGLELAGAAYEGVGIPACISSGRRAARAVATHLLSRGRGLPQ
jgi:oxygen-dependent protoporphyrinogen oxidase